MNQLTPHPAPNQLPQQNNTTALGSSFGYSYFGARYYASGLSIWLSVDPLSNKYPSMSVYMYCAGNPVMLVDPDGKRIWIREKGGDQQKILYKNGDLYQRKGLFGKEKYTGNDKFALQVKDDLNSIKDGDELGNKMVTTLENSGKNHKIKYGKINKVINVSDRDKKRASNGQGTSMTLQFTGNGGIIDNGDNNIPSTSESSLAHELVHMYDFDQGTLARGISRLSDIVTGEDAGLRNYEIPAVQYEHRVRKRLGLPLRHSYHTMERNSNGTIGKDAAVPYYEILIKHK